MAGNFKGIDGKTYDNAFDMARGDNFARMERQKAEDIQQQNRLLQENNRIQQQIANQNYELEMQKEKNKQLEADKQREHEKEMRLLKLFDGIGISKKAYDKYIEKNFETPTIVKKNKFISEKLFEISKYDFLLHEDDKKEEYGWDAIYNTMKKYDLFSLKENVREECKIELTGTKYEEKQRREEELRLYDKIIQISSISTFISFIALAFIASEFDTNLWIIPLIILVISILILIACCKPYKYVKDLLAILPKDSIDYDKYNRILKGKINKLNKEIEKVNKEIYHLIEHNIEEFDQFRISHYNSKMEKLLSDIEYPELLESYGIHFKKVNNSNKKKDGTIEDYIEYFENHS